MWVCEKPQAVLQFKMKYLLHSIAQNSFGSFRKRKEKVQNRFLTKHSQHNDIMSKSFSKFTQNLRK